MRPEPHDFPPVLSEHGVGFGIALAVAFDLLLPETGVRLRCCVVLRAPMPVATVDEDRELGPREQDVGGTPEGRYGALVHSVAQPHGVKQAADRQFGRCVSRLVPLHGGTGRSARSPGPLLHLTEASGTASPGILSD